MELACDVPSVCFLFYILVARVTWSSWAQNQITAVVASYSTAVAIHAPQRELPKCFCLFGVFCFFFSLIFGHLEAYGAHKDQLPMHREMATRYNAVVGRMRQLGKKKIKKMLDYFQAKLG